MPRCARCLEEKSLADFHLRRKGTAKPYCITCSREYAREDYAKKKAAYNARRRKNQRLSRKRNAEFVAGLKSVPCADCGGTFPPFVMHFDHVRDKSFNIGDHKSTGIGFKRLLAEIEKTE